VHLAEGHLAIQLQRDDQLITGPSILLGHLTAPSSPALTAFYADRSAVIPISANCTQFDPTRPIRTTERILLADSSDGERLAWEAGKEHIVVGDFIGRKADYVAN
jgi:hypothetical protein